MTFPSGGSVFEDELLTVKKYFEKWNGIERAIAMVAMLKQFQHPTLRFIQSKIEATNAQNSDSEKMKFMEQKSNDKSYINELCNKYKLLTNTDDVQSPNNHNNINNNNNNNNNINNKDSTYFESDRLIDSSTMNYNNNNNSYSNNNVNSSSLMLNVTDKFSTKEEILNEILNCILMLKIGNDDVIQEYLALIPYMVYDTQNYKINFEIVMQTLSILVAHPALSSDDLRTVKDHTDRLKNIIQNQNTNWQAIVKPTYHNKTLSTTIFSSLSSVGSERKASLCGSDYFISSVGLPCKQCHNNTNDDPYSFRTATDDQNISFSKNGTEIQDINLDQEQATSQFQKNLQFHLIENIAMKTRRSNSLTTGGMKPYDQYLAANFTSSTENLTHLQKQRSFSLSTENPRLFKTGSGSETRLDDLQKPAAYQAFQSHHTGMKYVGHWLKKLRLHKYCHAFEDMTFEQMMMIDEKFLERLSITQGARTKMVNSIQKLKERHARLTQIENDLKSGTMTIDAAIQLLTEFADTPMKPIPPMKPIGVYDTNNVAAQFLKVLNIVCNMLKSQMIGPLDEELIDQLIEIFDVIQLGNTEPFHTHANQLKEMRFEVDAIKRQFPPRNHYPRNGNGLTNGNSNKPRWTSSTKHNNRNASDLKPHRKNSNPMTNFNCQISAQQVQKQQKSQTHGSKVKQTQSRMCRKPELNFYQTPTSSQNKDSSKSSSYPNCSSSSSSNTNNCSRLNGQQYANINNQNANPQLHHSYHRHSVSNLSGMTPMVKTTLTITPAAPIPQSQKTSNSCVGLHLSPQLSSHLSGSNSSSSSAITPITSTIIPSGDYCLSCDSGHQFSMDWTPDSGRSHSTGASGGGSGGSSYPKQASNKHLLGDISPYKHLESLSLQMTEQAIN